MEYFSKVMEYFSKLMEFGLNSRENYFLKFKIIGEKIRTYKNNVYFCRRIIHETCN